jgi:hypothetical protein
MSDAMRLGNLIHEAFEYSLQNDCTTEKALKYLEFSFEDQAIQDKARGIIKYYAPLIGFGAGVKPYVHNGKPMLEYKFEVEVDGVQFLGYIDAIIYDPAGNIVLVDWKTRRSLLTSDQLAMDNQLYVYGFVAREILGIPIDKVCQVQIRTILPAKPKLLKSGAISKTLGKTTKEVFLQTLVDFDGFVDIEKTGNWLDDYASKFVPTSEFLRMSYIDTSKMKARTFEFIEWIKAIRSDTQFLPVNNSRICEWCQYTDLCVDRS